MTLLRPCRNLLSPGSRQVPIGALRINSRHQLARGLIGCWIPGAMDGVNIANSITPTLRLVTTASQSQMTMEGTGWSSTTGAVSIYTGLATDVFKTWTTSSMYWRGYRPAGASTGIPQIIAVFDPDSAANVYALAVSTAGQLRASWNIGGTPNATPISGILPTTIDSIAATFDNTGNVILYQNGVSVNTTAFGAPTQSAGVNTVIMIGGTTAVPTAAPNAIMTAGYCWNRLLTASEVAWLNIDPYAFLVPAEYEMPVPFQGTTAAQIYAFNQTGARFSRNITTIGY